MIAFLIVRIIGGFGNIHPPDGSGLMDFFNVTKYQPSIAFIGLTLGIIMIFLSLFSRAGENFQQWGNPLLVFGRTALFFYIAHLYIFAIMGLLIVPKEGLSFASMYVLLIVGLAILYPLCRWYGNFKKRKPPDSLWRFF